MASFRTIFKEWRKKAIELDDSIDSIISVIKEEFLHDSKISIPLRLTDNGFNLSLVYDYSEDDKEEEEEYDKQEDDEEDYDEDEVEEYTSYRDQAFDRQIKKMEFVHVKYEKYWSTHDKVRNISDDKKLLADLIEVSKRYGGPFYKLYENEEGYSVKGYDFEPLLQRLNLQFLARLKPHVIDFFDELENVDSNEVLEHYEGIEPYIVLHANDKLKL